MRQGKEIRADLVIFDLDGTLIDSSKDIAWSANRTLKAMGHAGMRESEIIGHIGWGVKPLLEKLMPTEGEERIMEARGRFLEIYGGHLVVATTLYPGVRNTLGHFREMGKKMAVVTNKPFDLSERILGEMDLKDFFLMVIGGDSLQNRKPHPEPVAKVISGLGISPSLTAVIGDSPIDCEAGKAAGAATIGAAYGFRGRMELEAAGCDLIVESFTELKDVLR